MDDIRTPKISETRVEQQLRELRDSGALRGLPGEGAPLPADPDADAGDAWAARHLSRGSAARPAWADLRQEIQHRTAGLIARLRAHDGWLSARAALLERLPAERIAQIRQAKPGLQLHVWYGQTECAPRVTALDPRRVDRKPDSAGAPVPGVKVLIVDETGREVPRGQVGEVVVCGENVMVGYWRQPEATARVIDSLGRLHTGDWGWLDEEGDLFLTGRRDAMIKSAGERIFAEEIEAVLLQCEGVLDAVVLGVPDDLAGERIEAHVGVVPPLPHEEEAIQHLADRIRGHCLGKVPFARAPKAYHIWADFPRKPNGKVDRPRMLAGR